MSLRSTIIVLEFVNVSRFVFPDAYHSHGRYSRMWHLKVRKFRIFTSLALMQVTWPLVLCHCRLFSLTKVTQWPIDVTNCNRKWLSLEAYATHTGKIQQESSPGLIVTFYHVITISVWTDNACCILCNCN